jgi:alkylation response protein AidB-like acyl-CoA dehydrogenase
MFNASNDVEMIRDSAKRLFASRYDLDFIRSLNEEQEKQDIKLPAVIQEMGWQALIVPEKHGGFGYGLAELCGLLQEHGYAAMPPLFFAIHVAPVLCLNALPDSDRKAELLESIANGQCLPNVAADSATKHSYSRPNSVEAIATDNGYTLSGTVNKLVSADIATMFFLPARFQDHTLFVSLDASEESLELTAHEDKSYGQTHSLSLKDTPVGENSVLATAAGDQLARAYHLCAIAKSAELIGGAERAMQFAVEHINSRKQFGKYLSEFQAVQHQAADMFKMIEIAKLFLQDAVQSKDGEQQFEMAAHCCKAWSNQANFQTTATSHQLMGGTGYMVETDLHLLTLHGLRNQYEFGSTDHHKEMIAGLLDLP